MPSSPPPIVPKAAPLPPTTTTPVVSPTRATPRNSAPPSPIEAGPSIPRHLRTGLTSAEAYANAHYPRQTREREKTVAGLSVHAPGAAVSKPIFDWITRKLGGGGRRATVTDFGPPRNGDARVRYPSVPRHVHTSNERRPAPPPPTELSTFTRQTSHSLSRGDSQSLHSYSFSPVSERRRQANNPYPSLPVPLVQPQHHRETSTIDVSFLSRSRTPSLRSEASLTSSFPQRISLADDGSSFRLAGRVADEDASVRPLPPSHRASPTPSHSRSASTSLLSPQPSGLPTSPSLKGRDNTSIGGDRSFASSEPEEGRQSRRDSSRRDSASTKPTTIVSIDGPLPTTHIAQSSSTYQVPPSPLRGSISRDQDGQVSAEASPIPPTTPTLSLTQAPKHSHPHPRDNPRPSSPPEPNASTLTLASSTFAAPVGGSWTPSVPSLYQRPSSIHQLSSGSTPYAAAPPWGGASPVSTPLVPGPGPGTTAYRPPSLATSPSVTWAPATDRNSLADYPPSLHPTLGTSFRTGGWAGSRGAADRDASVRAVRRKGSWESNESGWSWRGANGGVISPGVPGAATPGGHIPPPPLLHSYSSSSGSAAATGAEHTPRLSQLAPALELTLPIDLTDRMDEDVRPRDSRQLHIDTGIAA